MIKKIRIENFRSCRDVVVEDLGLIAALVGRNGAGKSNILQCISEISRAAVSGDGSVFQNLAVANRSVTVTLEFDLEVDRFRYVAGVSMRVEPSGIGRPALAEKLERLEGGSWATLIGRTGLAARIGDSEELLIGEFAPAIVAATTFLPPDHPLYQCFRRVQKFLSGIRYYAFDEFNAVARSGTVGPISAAAYDAWLTEHKTTGRGTDSVALRLINLWLERRQDFDALVALLGSNGLGLLEYIGVQLLNFSRNGPGDQAPPIETYYIIEFRPLRGRESASVSVQYDQLSTGTRRALRIFISVVFDGSTVMLVEQPEDFLHPGLTKKLIGLLRTNAPPAQVLLSTHSPALVNRLKPEEIRIVSMEGGFTASRALGPSEISAATRFIDEDGPLSDFLESVQER